MQFVIGLALVVAAVGWFGDKLKAAGVGWDGFAAFCVLGGIAVFIATILKQNWEGPQQDPAPVMARSPVSGALPAPVVLASDLSRPLYLRYDDGRGRVTERVLVVLEAFSDRPGGAITHLRGFCQLRRGVRTFRRARILVAADPDTGEVVADLDAHLLGRPGCSPHDALPKRVQQQQATVQKVSSPWG